MKKIFKERGAFYVVPTTCDGFECGKRYSERSLKNYLINEAPNIDIDTNALSRSDKDMVMGAYLKGLKIFNKKNLGI